MAIGLNGLSAQAINLIKDAIALAPEVNLNTPGKKDPYYLLTKSEFKSNISLGDNVKLLVPGEVTLNDGIDIEDVEYPTNTNITITVKDSKSFCYGINKLQADQMNASAKDGSPFLKEWALNIGEKYINAVIGSLVGLATEGRFNFNAQYNARNGIADLTAPMKLTQTNIFGFMAYTAGMLKTGYTLDGTPRIPWTEGKMAMIIHPDQEALITSSTRFQYTSDGLKITEKGYIGELAGWSLYTSPYVPVTTITVGETQYLQYTPCFGVKERAFGLIMGKELNTMHFIPQFGANAFDDTFKGYGYFGSDPARTDTYGFANVYQEQSLGA